MLRQITSPLQGISAVDIRGNHEKRENVKKGEKRTVGEN
jgi:hypothetical protein